MRKGLKIFLSVFVLVIVAGLVIAAGIGSRDNVTGKWFQQPDLTKWFYSWGKEADDNSEDNIQIMSYTLAAEDYADYGISEQAIKAGVLTAEYMPSNTTNKRTNWTYRWAGNDWSQGKKLSDYADFFPGSNYAPECQYAIKQPFGDTIIVQAASRANSSIKASVQIDYVARYWDFWNENDKSLSYGEDINFLEGFEVEDYVYSAVPDSYVVSNVVMTVYDPYGFSSTYGDCGKVNNVEDFIGCGTGSDRATALELLRTQGIITWNDLTGFLGGADKMAKYQTDYDTEYVGSLSATITCYFNGEEMYSFTYARDFGLSYECMQEVSTPPTGVTVSPGVVGV